MGIQTRPSYFTHSWTAVRGCQEATLPDGSAHPGCLNCYARRNSTSHRQCRKRPLLYGRWGDEGHGVRVTGAEAYWNEPRTWKPGARILYTLGDLFEPWDGPICNVKGEPISGLTMRYCVTAYFQLVRDTPQHHWLVTTKRPERIRELWPHELGRPVHIPNLSIGVSVSDQKSAELLLPILMEQAPPTLTPIRFVSAEPLIGPLDLTPWLRRQRGEPTRLDWVIAGGESGKNCRPLLNSWLYTILEDVREAELEDHMGPELQVYIKQGSGPLNGQQYGISDALWAIKGIPQCLSE